VTVSQFVRLISAYPEPVVLLEGRREISDDMAAAARRFACLLAARLPQLKFRSGNASGSDEAFARGVADCDPSRMELIVPYKGHRRAGREGVRSFSADDLSFEQRAIVAEATYAASPRSRGLMQARSPRLQAKASYLLRDTLKVLGHGGGLAPPAAGFFYVDPEDAMAGGTGHTIRVCQQLAVPVILQKDWLEWMPDLESGEWPVVARSYPRPKNRVQVDAGG